MTCDVCKDISQSSDRKPFVPPKGSCHDKTHVCGCGAKWWQFNRYYHLWREIPDATYRALRHDSYVVIDVDTGVVVGHHNSHR